jgi:hypothetical protein
VTTTIEVAQIAGFPTTRDWTPGCARRDHPHVAQTIQLNPPRRRKPIKPPRVPKPPPSRGRAWINGSEVGGTDPRFAHLDRSYD